MSAVPVPCRPKVASGDRHAAGPVTSERRPDGIAIVLVDSPPVNALSAAVREGLAEAFRSAFADPAVRAVVLACRGRTFVAGADIREFGKPRQGIGLTALGDLLDQGGKPVVAAIHGTALGGGLELALACSARVAVGPARLGLPEVKLGIVPGGGGTQRLPHLVGVEQALAMVTTGDPVDAATALRIGLVDEVIEGDLVEGAVEFARRLTAKDASRRARDVADRLEEARRDPNLFERVTATTRKRFRGQDAPVAAIACVRAALDLPFEEGLRFEREQFELLVAGRQSAAMRHAFFAEREAQKVPGLGSVRPRTVRSVGVVGAGTMGAGIATAFADAGIPVTLVDLKPEVLERGLATIRKTYDTSVGKGRITPAERDARTDRVKGALDLSALAGCDLIIEAIYEDLTAKQAIFGKLDEVAQPDAILATNTSYLDVNVIARATRRPASVLGLHFFSPASVMRLVEVVRGDATDPTLVSTALQLAKRLGKVPVVSGVGYGFIGNRMLARRREQAHALVLEGTMPWDVDRVLTDFGFAMGPFAVSDLAGLDLGWTHGTSRGETLTDLLNEAGRHGQKSGAGFYDYDGTRVGTPSPDVERIVVDLSARRGISRRPVSDEEILNRCILPMVDEGARILGEGIALRASDIDVVWLSGYGWPVYRGGPMFFAETLGLQSVLARLEKLRAQHGEAFAPSTFLVRAAAAGGWPKPKIT